MPVGGEDVAGMAQKERGGGWGRRGLAGSLAAAGLLLVNGLGCGSGSTHGGGESKTGPDGGVGGDVNTPALNVQGGSASSPGGQGQNGGVVHLVAQGDVVFDSSQAAAQMPDPPASAMAVDAAALAADVSITGDAVVNGDVASGGADVVRKIVVSGDLYVHGKLRSADLGAARQALDLQAGGTIYVSGTVDTSGAAGAGQAGGNVTLKAGGGVALAGTVRFGGGAANGSGGGGAGATLTIDADGAVQLGGIIDGRGGAATGGAVAGGAAGAVHVGESAAPMAIAVVVPVVATGGDGDASAGVGGTVTPEPATGTVTIAGAREIDVSGGSSLAAPGAGGLVTGGPRTDPGSGGLHITGEIIANGGSVRAGGSGNGAEGGRVDFQLVPTDGAVTIDQGATITVEGGASGGAGTAGGGGHVWFFTKDGDANIGGTISVKGGNAPDPGGVGGLGGMIYFFTDNNHDAIHNDKGNLHVLTTGLLDASGGMGATGGAGRSDGIPGLVPSFPDNQEQIAIFLNCDGAHGNTLNWMVNDGHLIARGGAHNGAGGDIVYHGIPPGVYGTGGAGSGDYPVPPGNVDMAGDGTGPSGDFDGE
jgi:hypothetical protein